MFCPEPCLKCVNDVAGAPNGPCWLDCVGVVRNYSKSRHQVDIRRRVPDFISRMSLFQQNRWSCISRGIRSLKLSCYLWYCVAALDIRWATQRRDLVFGARFMLLIWRPLVYSSLVDTGNVRDRTSCNTVGVTVRLSYKQLKYTLFINLVTWRMRQRIFIRRPLGLSFQPSFLTWATVATREAWAVDQINTVRWNEISALFPW